VRGRDQFDKDGFLVVRELLSVAECNELADELGDLLERQQRVTSRSRGGLRNVLQASPRAAAVAASEKFIATVSDFTGGRAFPVRAILFDKTDGAN
jgi:hypothetical protein